jgi:uncharacterized integral membrane protein (TIGR00698 family)
MSEVIDRSAVSLAHPTALAGLAKLAPGLGLTAAITAVAYLLRQIPGVATFSPMILAILIGLALRNVVGMPAAAKPGVIFAMRRVLRLAIILLGLQLTATQVVAVGPTGLVIILASVGGTFVVTTWVGRLLGVSPALTQLIAGGTSICGASAVVAVNTVTGASDEDVTYAVACVTIFGSIAMFAYPALLPLLHLTHHAYGLWAGASIHEIAQVVAASFQVGPDAGDFGMIAKLTRVMMLAPVVLALGALATRGMGVGGGTAAKAPIPWFVLGFLALVVVNSIVVFPSAFKADMGLTTNVLLSMALAAMGLETDIGKLRARGFKPFLLGLIATLFIAGFSLLMVMLAG